MKLNNPAHQRNCIGKTLKIIGSKWTILLLHELCGGTKRFGELQKLLPGISPKTLSLRLKELEKEKLVFKKIFPEIPLRVEYTLTEKGKSLKEIILKMQKWGEIYP
jgi:DNA-binding HxlR family transcriptional regulator